MNTIGFCENPKLKNIKYELIAGALLQYCKMNTFGFCGSPKPKNIKHELTTGASLQYCTMNIEH